MSTKPISIQVTPAQKEQWDTLVQNLKDNGQNISNGAIFQDLLDTYYSKKTAPANLQKENEELKKALEESAQTAKELAELKELFGNQGEDKTKLFEELSTALEEKAELETQLNELKQQFASRLQLTDNQSIMTYIPKVKQVIELVCERLSEKYNRTITPEELMQTMFMRYIVEQYTEWFFPLNTISKQEISDLTEKTIQEWKNHFNGKADE